MSSNVGMETKAEGGLLGGLKRMALGGESFFINTYTAQGGPGEITVGPSLPGDVIHLQLAGHTVFVQSGSYLACAAGIEVDTKWGGAKMFFSGEGLVVKLTGPGRVWMQTRSPSSFVAWLVPQLPTQRG